MLISNVLAVRSDPSEMTDLLLTELLSSLKSELDFDGLQSPSQFTMQSNEWAEGRTSKLDNSAPVCSGSTPSRPRGSFDGHGPTPAPAARWALGQPCSVALLAVGNVCVRVLMAANRRRQPVHTQHCQRSSATGRRCFPGRAAQGLAG
jgi:hypothetical protein